MSHRNRKLSFSQKPRFEQLESRELLHGHVFGAAASAARAQNVPAIFGPQVAGRNQTAAALQAASQQTTLSATLTDATTGATANVAYQTGTVGGVVNTKFSVTVSGAAADSTLDVTLDGVLVGQITTDASGAGSLSLASTPKGTTQLPLPVDFPTTVAAGAAVSVGTLSGTLTASTATPTHGGGCSAATTTTLTAPLTDSGGTATGTVTFRTSTMRGAATSSLTVSITGATADSSLDVSIDGTVVGQVTTDASGAGSLVLSSNTTTLPSIAAGSTVSVGTLSGTFASATSTSNSAAARLRFR